MWSSCCHVILAYNPLVGRTPICYTHSDDVIRHPAHRCWRYLQYTRYCDVTIDSLSWRPLLTLINARIRIPNTYIHIWAAIYIHTHTHTHTRLYIYIYVYLFIQSLVIRYRPNIQLALHFFRIKLVEYGLIHTSIWVKLIDESKLFASVCNVANGIITHW